MPERLVPQSLEAEQSVLGAALQNPFAADEIVSVLRSNDFSNRSHGEIFEAIKLLVDEKNSVDIVTVSEALKRRGTLEAIGGRKYLAEIMGMVPAPTNAPSYAKIVSEKATLRNLIETANKIISRSTAQEDDAADVLDDAEREILAIGQRDKRAEYYPISDVLERNILRMEELNKKSANGLTGLTTGFPDLDRMTLGLQPSELIILAARPSMGKTSLALNIAANAAIKENAKVMIFSLEMDELQLGMRMLSVQAMIPSDELRSGRVLNEKGKISKIAEAQKELSERTINIDSTSGIQIGEIRNKCRRMMKDTGLDLVVIDYLQLMDIGGNAKNSSRPENRQQEIATLSRMLKQLARELKCPFLVLSQLSRAVEQRGGHKPNLSDLRESGAIEQDADIVMFIYKEEAKADGESHPDPESTRKLYIAKNRNGETGLITLQWLGQFTKFAHYDPSQDPLLLV